MALVFPPSPSPGDVFIPPGGSGVVYTWNTSVTPGVWTARRLEPFVIATPGSITGTAAVGSTLTYTTGSAAGGLAPYSYSWNWIRVSDGLVLASNTPTLVIPANCSGDTVAVRFTASDSYVPVQTLTEDTPATATVVVQPFPNTNFSPANAPNASPAAVNWAAELLYGTANATYGETGTTLTVSGQIQVSIAGGAFNGAGSYGIANGNSIAVIWDPAVISTATQGQVLTGSVNDGTYQKDFTMTVDRAPNPVNALFSDIANQAVNTTVSSNVATPAGFNVPIPVAFAGTATDPLIGPKAAIGGGGMGGSPTSMYPSQTIQLQGVTGGLTATAYGIDVTLSSGGEASSGTWTASTVSGGGAGIVDPSILTPVNGATGVGTASGITITSSAYAAYGGAGTHASSDWELATDAAFTTVVASVTGSTTDLTSWFVAVPPVAPTTTYYVRVRYTSNATVVTSDWSPGSSFTTGSLSPKPSGLTLIGTATTDVPCGINVINNVIYLGWGTNSDENATVMVSQDDAQSFVSTVIIDPRGPTGGSVYTVGPMMYNGSEVAAPIVGGSRAAIIAYTSDNGSTWVQPTSPPGLGVGQSPNPPRGWWGSTPSGKLFIYTGNSSPYDCRTGTNMPVLPPATSGFVVPPGFPTMTGDYAQLTTPIEGSPGNMFILGNPSTGTNGTRLDSTDSGATWGTATFNYFGSLGLNFSMIGSTSTTQRQLGPNWPTKRFAQNGSKIMICGCQSDNAGVVNGNQLRTIFSTDGGTSWTTQTVATVAYSGGAIGGQMVRHCGGTNWLAMWGENNNFQRAWPLNTDFVTMFWYFSSDDGSTWTDVSAAFGGVLPNDIEYVPNLGKFILNEFGTNRIYLTT